jgi:large subunit ribosomal protein L23
MTKIYKGMPATKAGVTYKYDIILSPALTEKSTDLAAKGCYVFNVRADANKVDIKKAIEELFNVKVAAVNTLNRRGKEKRFKGKIGHQSSLKRAFVKLADGQSFDFSMGV